MELNDVGKDIENNLQELQKLPTDSQKNSENEKEKNINNEKKSLNFEEYKKKLSKNEIKEESPSNSFSHVNQKSISSIEITPKKSQIHPPEPNQPLTLKNSINDRELTEKPIDVWLNEIHLDSILQNFLDLGLKTNGMVLDILKQQTNNWDKLLITHLGIDKPGYRKRIITKLKEDMGLCRRSGLFKLKHSNARLKFLDLGEWLKSLDLEEWHEYFGAAGYDDYESLIFQMTTDHAINEKILEEDVMIDDPLARMKICNQLMEGNIRT